MIKTEAALRGGHCRKTHSRLQGKCQEEDTAHVGSLMLPPLPPRTMKKSRLMTPRRFQSRHLRLPRCYAPSLALIVRKKHA